MTLAGQGLEGKVVALEGDASAWKAALGFLAVDWSVAARCSQYSGAVGSGRARHFEVAN